MGSSELINSDFMGFEIRQSYSSEEYSAVRYKKQWDKTKALFAPKDKVFSGYYRQQDICEAIKKFVEAEERFKTIRKKVRDYFARKYGYKDFEAVKVDKENECDLRFTFDDIRKAIDLTLEELEKTINNT